MNPRRASLFASTIAPRLHHAGVVSDLPAAPPGEAQPLPFGAGHSVLAGPRDSVPRCSATPNNMPRHGVLGIEGEGKPLEAAAHQDENSANNAKRKDYRCLLYWAFKQIRKSDKQATFKTDLSKVYDALKNVRHRLLRSAVIGRRGDKGHQLTNGLRHGKATAMLKCAKPHAAGDPSVSQTVIGVKPCTTGAGAGDRTKISLTNKHAHQWPTRRRRAW